jgi:hypothetical protein
MKQTNTSIKERVIMKTKVRVNGYRALQITALLAVATFLGVLLARNIATASDRDEKAPAGSPCKTTALLVFESEMAGATAEYLLDKAKASTLPTLEERKEANDEAIASFKERKPEIRDQYKARLAICRMLGESRYNPVVDPANFLTPAETAAKPHPYHPLIPGTLYRYRSVTTEGTETIEVRVTRDTREILGVTCIEVRDTVSVPGGLVEDTRDWYAQDKDGNVWYFGEISVNYVNGEISDLEGSWEAGVDGAKPGIVMKASPQIGDVYRQEYLIGEAEDCAKVVALNETVTVPYGTFGNCWKTAEFLPFEPDTLVSPPNKYYAPNIGFVVELKPDGEREELIAIETF